MMQVMAVRHDLEALAALYAEADRELKGWTCEVSTDCCHFGRTGREPQLWPNERAMIERALAERGGRLPAPPRGLPIVGQDEGRCPLLDARGRCSVYAARPFGCRTFFCDRASGPERRPPRAPLAAIGRKLAELAEREDPRAGGPRPLTSGLARRRRGSP
jgi:Fe-S-cluster containining protein